MFQQPNTTQFLQNAKQYVPINQINGVHYKKNSIWSNVTYMFDS